MIESYSRWILRWRWLVILLTLLMVAASASGARFLKFETDYRVFFSADNPQLLAFNELERTFTKNDNVLLVLAPKSGEVFSRETLAAVVDITREGWNLPFSTRVDSLSNFQHTTAVGDDLVVADLVEDPASLTPDDLQRIREVAMREPNLVRRLVAPAGDVTGVNITVELPGLDKGTETDKVTRAARELVERIRVAHPDLEVHLTGMAIMSNAFPEMSRKDITTLVPVMFAVVLVMLAFMLRSGWSVLSTFLVILFSIVTGMGLAGWLGIVLTGPSANAPTIILTMAVADCVHLLVSFLVAYAMLDRDHKQDALVEAMRINFGPMFLTSLTTALGFLSMNSSDAPPFRDLGNIVTLGVVAAWLYSVTFLPALMAVLPVRKPRQRSKTSHAMESLGEWVIRWRNPLLWGTTLVSVGLTLLVPLNHLNDEFVKYFSERVDFRRATDFSSARLSGIYQISYALGAGESSGVSDPVFLERVEAFAQWYASQPEVTHIQTLTDTFKRLNRTMHGDDPAYYRLPETRELAAQYLLLYEMSLPYGLDLNNMLNVDKSKTRFTVTLQNISTNQILDLERRAQAWLRDNAPASMQVNGSSPTVMFANIGHRNIRSMLVGTVLALVLISLTMILSLRSWKLGLLSLVPNLLPAGMAFGLWGVFSGQVGLALSVVTGMTLGIVVDDTIHFLSKYLRARREKNLTAPDAVRYAFATVGNALWVTTLVLVCGFLVLTFSNFRLNSEMGLMTALAIAIALVVDFLMLPPLLLKLEEHHVATTR
ncbi:MAG: efflux RND transporter permease subunit [Magnetococcus sp. WYHC-3]